MKKVKRRAASALLIAALLVVGLAVYLVRLADDGGAWASYFNGGTPGGTILYRAHEVLEMITIDKDTKHMKQKLAVDFADLVYNGQWYTPLRQALSAFVDSTQETVTGDMKLKLYKGNIMPVSVTSPFSLYSAGMATFDEDDCYDQSDSAGFIHLYGLPLKVRAIKAKEEPDMPGVE